MNAAEITDKLGLHSLRHRNWYIQATCATSGDGLYEGLDWLANQLKNKKWGARFSLRGRLSLWERGGTNLAFMFGFTLFNLNIYLVVCGLKSLLCSAHTHTHSHADQHASNFFCWLFHFTVRTVSVYSSDVWTISSSLPHSLANVFTISVVLDCHEEDCWVWACSCIM